MYFIIGDVRQGTRRDYVAHKIRRTVESIHPQRGALLGADFVDTQVAALLSDGERPSLALVDAGDFPALDQAQQTEIDIAKRCARMRLVVESPLVDGEEVVEDAFTYLKEPFVDCPAGTGALHRRTNMADLFYIFDNVVIDNGKLVYPQEEVPELPAVVPRVAAGLDFDIGKLVKELLGKAAGAGGGAIGSLVFKLVMKEIFGQEDDTAKFVSAVQKVVREEIVSDRIDLINGRIEGTLLFMTNDYQERKKRADLSKVHDREELLHVLDQYSERFYGEVMGVLEQDSYARKGLKSYQIAASMHLILTQEQALVDPKSMNPKQSGFAQTLSRNARHYREHVEGTFDGMVNERLAKIGSMEAVDTRCYKWGCKSEKVGWAWFDSEAHEGRTFRDDAHKDPPSAKDLAERAASAQRDKVYAQMAADTANPRTNSIPQLKQLEATPIP
jgi:hypothetical protein